MRTGVDGRGCALAALAVKLLHRGGGFLGAVIGLVV
jgi:hypothetical protein